MKNTDGEPRRCDSCAAADFQLPAGESFKVDGLEEEFVILPQEFAATVLLHTAKKPQLGEQTITVRFDFKACGDKMCFPPDEILIEAPVMITREL